MTPRPFGPPYSKQEALDAERAASQVELTSDIGLLSDLTRGALTPAEAVALRERLDRDPAFRALAMPILRLLRERPPTVRSIEVADVDRIEACVRRALLLSSEDSRLTLDETELARRRQVVRDLKIRFFGFWLLVILIPILLILKLPRLVFGP